MTLRGVLHASTKSENIFPFQAAFEIKYFFKILSDPLTSALMVLFLLLYNPLQILLPEKEIFEEFGYVGIGSLSKKLDLLV